MRASVLLGAALAGLTVAKPLAKRQGIEFDLIDAADPVELTTAPSDPTVDPGSYDADAAASDAAADPVTTAAAKMIKRGGDCSALPKGYAPLTTPDTVTDFLANPQYAQMASAAVVPDGYTLAFTGLNGATQSDSYITYKNLNTYDPYLCQQFCDSVDSCYNFNLYMERDPSIVPGAACPNPASVVYFKCALFGAKLTNTTATNTGQGRYQFSIAIAGSNGYNKLAGPSNIDGFQSPVELAGSTNAPDNSYIGAKYFAGPYNPGQCASSCIATSAYNKAHPRSDGSFDTCSFFNSYVLSKNGAPQGTYCGMYTKTWAKSYAVNYGQYRGSDRYTVSQSYGWTLSA